MPERITSAASMADWMRMLDQVQDSLTEALRQTEEQEQVLAEAQGAAGGEWSEAGRRCFMKPGLLGITHAVRQIRYRSQLLQRYSASAAREVEV